MLFALKQEKNYHQQCKLIFSNGKESRMSKDVLLFLMPEL